MNFTKGPLPKTLLQFAVLVSLVMPSVTFAAVNMNCLDCHKNYADDQYTKTFIHKPFLQKKCLSCHSPDWVDNMSASEGKAKFPKKIKHIGGVETPAAIHLFVIPEEVAPQIIFLEAKSSTSGSFRTKLKIPPFDTLNPLSSDATPPVISDIKVTEVELGNLARAKITWKTDKHANTTLFYGIGETDHLVHMADCYMSEHSVELTKLLPEKTYNFQIAAEDIYGNRRESAMYSFSTDKGFKSKDAKQPGNTKLPFHIESEIFRSENNYVLRIKANQPISMEISTYDMPNFPLLRETSDKTPANHPALKSIYETNLLACENCHLAPNDVFPHEVHFRARLGSNIPEEYPRLPNGQMSCITCHYPHASDNQFHLRKSADRTLCVGCHKRLFRKR